MKLLPKIAATLALFLNITGAQALDTVPYSQEAVSAAQSAGKSIALHFHANWCPTCRAQEKVFNDLKPDASLPLMLFVVDYDKERTLKQQLGVRSQSTVIVYRGKKETARVAGETDPVRLRAALQTAL